MPLVDEAGQPLTSPTAGGSATPLNAVHFKDRDGNHWCLNRANVSAIARNPNPAAIGRTLVVMTGGALDIGLALDQVRGIIFPESQWVECFPYPATAVAA